VPQSEAVPLTGEELLRVLEELDEEGETCLQERVYEANYTINSEPDYYEFSNAVLEAEGVDSLDVSLESLDPEEIGYIAIEVGTGLKRENLYGDLLQSLKSEKPDTSLREYYQLAKRICLVTSFDGAFTTGRITDYIDNKIGWFEPVGENSQALSQLRSKYSLDTACADLTSETVEEWGFLFWDEHGNEYPDFLAFVEALTADKEDLHAAEELSEKIDYKLILEDVTERLSYALPYRVDEALWDNTPSLEAAAIISRFKVSLHLDDCNGQEEPHLTSALHQEVMPESHPNDICGGTLPAGRYWVGDLSYAMHEYFERYIYRTTGVNIDQDGTPYARFETKYGDGFYADDVAYGFGVDTGCIGCVPASSVEDNPSLSLGKYVDFDTAFECKWHEVGGYIQFGHIWIKTDLVDDVGAIHQQYNSCQARSSLGFGFNFFKNDSFKNSSLKEKSCSESFWRDLRSKVENNDLADKTVQIIYELKNGVLRGEVDASTAFNSLISNYGPNRCAKAFYRVFKDVGIFLLSDNDRERVETIRSDRASFFGTNKDSIMDDLQNEHPSFVTAITIYYSIPKEREVDLCMDLWEQSHSPLILELRKYVAPYRVSPPEFKAEDIPKVVDMSLDQDPEEVAYRKMKEAEDYFSKIGSRLRKEIWPEGQEASTWWENLAGEKDAIGDKAYSAIASAMAKFHLRECSGDAVFVLSASYETEDRMRVFQDIEKNGKWF